MKGVRLHVSCATSETGQHEIVISTTDDYDVIDIQAPCLNAAGEGAARLGAVNCARAVAELRESLRTATLAYDAWPEAFWPFWASVLHRAHPDREDPAADFVA